MQIIIVTYCLDRTKLVNKFVKNSHVSVYAVELIVDILKVAATILVNQQLKPKVILVRIQWA